MSQIDKLDGEPRRHPHLATNFEERLQQARIQRAEVMAKRAADADQDAEDRVVKRLPPVSVAAPPRVVAARPPEPPFKLVVPKDAPAPKPVLPSEMLRQRMTAPRPDTPRISAPVAPAPQVRPRRRGWVVPALIAMILAAGLVAGYFLLDTPTTRQDVQSAASRTEEPSMPGAPPVGAGWTPASLVAASGAPGAGVSAPARDRTVMRSLPADAGAPPRQSDVPRPVAGTPVPAVRADAPRALATADGRTLAATGRVARDTAPDRSGLSRLPRADASETEPVMPHPLTQGIAVLSTAPAAERASQARSISLASLRSIDSIAATVRVSRPDRAAIPGTGASPAFVCPGCDDPATPGFSQSVTLMMPRGETSGAASALIRVLGLAGFGDVSSRASDLDVTEAQVRYFNAADATAARRLAEVAQARLIDLTWVDPALASGRIELWPGDGPLAGNG